MNGSKGRGADDSPSVGQELVVVPIARQEDAREVPEVNGSYRNRPEVTARLSAFLPKLTVQMLALTSFRQDD